MYHVTCIDILTERDGRTGEYWPKAVAVGTERRKTTEGLVRCSLYGIVSLRDRTPSPLGECSSSISEL